MFDFTPHSFHMYKHRMMWYGLAFQAGIINAGGFLATSSFVSHVTGFGTMIGIKAGHGDFLAAIELMAVPGSFLLGAMVSAFFIERPRAHKTTPHYTLVMGLIASILIAVFIFGNLGWLGHFGDDFVDFRDVILVSMLSFVCGMQNSAIVSATRGAIRTTHLTGLTTDIGINLVRIRYFDVSSKEKEVQRLINHVRIFTFWFFSVGSAVSAILFSRYHFHGFIVPAVISSIFFIISARTAYLGRADAHLKRMPVFASSRPMLPD